MHVEHLHRRMLAEHGPQGESCGQWYRQGSGCEAQTARAEVDKNIHFDAVLELLIDGTQLQIISQVLERRLDLDDLNTELAQICRASPPQVRAEQIPAVAPARSLRGRPRWTGRQKVEIRISAEG